MASQLTKSWIDFVKDPDKKRIDPDVDLKSLSNPVNEQLREGMKAKG